MLYSRNKGSVFYEGIATNENLLTKDKYNTDVRSSLITLKEDDCIDINTPIKSNMQNSPIRSEIKGK